MSNPITARLCTATITLDGRGTVHCTRDAEPAGHTEHPTYGTGHAAPSGYPDGRGITIWSDIALTAVPAVYGPYQPTDTIDAQSAAHQILGDLDLPIYTGGDLAQALRQAATAWAPTPTTTAPAPAAA
jgi:hypothetical protein